MSSSQFSKKVRVRVCAVIVQNSSILLAKIKPPTRKDPIWMPPGGGVELGETLDEALLREIKEESGLIIIKKQLLWIHEFIEEPYHAVEFYFSCDVKSGILKKGFDPELESSQQMLLDLSFIPFNKAVALALEPNFIREFCRNNGMIFKDVHHVISKNPPLKAN